MSYLVLQWLNISDAIQKQRKEKTINHGQPASTLYSSTEKETKLNL